MGKLEGKAAVVTGAGDGIGRGIARRFAREGARVWLAEKDAARGRVVAAEIGDEIGMEVEFLVTDVARKSDVEAAVNRCVGLWGRVDIVVNNAWGGGHINGVSWAPELP